jgi:hypothetical protein
MQHGALLLFVPAVERFVASAHKRYVDAGIFRFGRLGSRCAKAWRVGSPASVNCL